MPPSRSPLWWLAHKLEKETGTPAPVLYGLFRQGMPQDVTALHATTNPACGWRLCRLPPNRESSPKRSTARRSRIIFPAWRLSAASKLQGLLGRILNEDELNTFVDQYLKDGQDPDAFWKQIAADPAWAGRADGAEAHRSSRRVWSTTTCPWSPRILETPDIRQASDLVRLTEEEWKSLIQTQGVGVPAETPGASADEKTQNYVRQIVRQVEAAFPTRFLAERLGRLPVATFLKSQPSYDLKTTYPEQFFKNESGRRQIA